MRESWRKGPDQKKKEQEVDLSRRGFLKGMGKAAAYGAVALSSPSIAEYVFNKRKWVIGQLTDAQHSTDQDINNTREFFKEAYGLSIHLGESLDGKSTGDNLTLKQARSALTRLVFETQRYPLDFFQKNGITELWVCTNLRHTTNIPFFPQKVAGLFVPNVHQILVEYSDDNVDYFDTTFHHEIYHALDWNDKGFAEDNEEWKNMHINCACSPYSNQTEHSSTKERLDFFANQHGSTNVWEDRATIAEALLMPALHHALLQRIASSSKEARIVLEKKVAAIKRDYLKWSNGKMDEEYWADIAQKGAVLSRNTNPNDNYSYESGYETEHVWDASYEENPGK